MTDLRSLRQLLDDCAAEIEGYTFGSTLDLSIAQRCRAVILEINEALEES